MSGSNIIALLALMASITVTSGGYTGGREFIALPGKSRVLLGNAVNPHDLPMAKCAYRSEYPSKTTCQVVTRDGSRCNTSYFTRKQTDMVSLTQLPGKKVLLHVRHTWDGDNELLVKDNLTLVDMNSCERVDNASLRLKAKQVIPYEDGSYDVVLVVREGSSSDDFRLEHYNANGRRSGEPRNILLGWEDMEVQAASKKSSTLGVMVRGHWTFGSAPTGLKLLSTAGIRKVTDVLELNSRTEIVSSVDLDKYYTVCGRSSDSKYKVECKRLDMRTDRVLGAQFDWDSHDTIRDVRASDAGIVLFGIQMGKDHMVEKLVVAEVNPRGQSFVRKIDLPWKASVKDNCKIRDFDGAKASFTLACEVVAPERGVALHKFDLPGKA